jgi:hypothetical protein
MEHFLTNISKKYNLETDIILNEWKDFDNLSTLYNKMKKPELIEACRMKGLKSVGSKPELIVFLIDEVKEVEEPKKPDLKRKKETFPETKSNIVNRILANIPTLVIRRNAFGNHEHMETKFVFDPKTKKVVGKQLDDGNVAVLSKIDVETCHMHKFDYEIPEMLDTIRKGIDTDTNDLMDEDVMNGIYEEESDVGDENDSDEEIEYNS